MTSSIFWDGLCPEHGGLSHVVIHEAGHAVVGVQLNLRFVDVSVNKDPRDHHNEMGRLTGGGVRVDSPEVLAELVRNDPAGSLRFFLAGALAEKGGFGHTLDNSYSSDLNLWRNFAGLVEAQTVDSLAEILGCSLGEIYRSTQELLVAHGAEVSAVARVLGTSDEWTLTYGEVCEVIASSN